MLLFISSNLQEINPQTKLILNCLENAKIPFNYLDPHELLLGSNWEISNRNGDMYLSRDGIKIMVSSIFTNSNWRTDTILKIPKHIKFPNISRNRIGQFMNDLRFCFELIPWIPGKIEDMERSDSKLLLYQKAQRHGFIIPESTINSRKKPDFSLEFYRKSLGYPFNLSINRESGSESTIVTINKSSMDLDVLEDGDFWQWQTPIKASKQVRCQIVGDKIWSVEWDRKSQLEDLRSRNDISSEKILTKSHQLPTKLKSSLISLSEELGVCISSPEFLIKDNGDYVLIDFNSGGDWYGFFEKDSLEIAQNIIELIKLKTL